MLPESALYAPYRSPSCGNANAPEWAVEHWYTSNTAYSTWMAECGTPYRKETRSTPVDFHRCGPAPPHGFEYSKSGPIWPVGAEIGSLVREEGRFLYIVLDDMSRCVGVLLLDPTQLSLGSPKAQPSRSEGSACQS